MEEYTDAQKWFLITTPLDGTLLCTVFRSKFGVDMSNEKNKSLAEEKKKCKIKSNPFANK